MSRQILGPSLSTVFDRCFLMQRSSWFHFRTIPDLSFDARYRCTCWV